ncbi:MAG: hypothetical protein M9955_11610 [Rhizobiaceae bacterium]|nr:hypothetical protein [Rhizobiaceae bacterium]
MARTLVGQLILKLRAEGLGEADKVARTLRDIDSAARTLGKVRAGDWGAAFGKQLAQLKATPAEIEAVRRSWTNLVADLDNKNITKALRKQKISTWKTATISHLAAVRAEAQETEKRIVAMHRSLGYGLKPLMVMGGGYTGAYLGGVMGREALIAASNERRVQAEAKYAGLDVGERGKIDTRADELAERYRLQKSEIYDVLKEASLSMPSTEAALNVSEEMARAYLVLSNMMGPEGALGGLRQFNKALDNIERVTPEEYRYGLENFIKAQQIVGRDIDPTAFAEAIKYARAGGKVFGDEFLFQWLPMLIAESGGSDSGTQLRAAFDQFIVGRASKAALSEQEALGLRDEAGRLLNQEKFTENPLTWIWDTMLPKLREKGVDTENETELARVVGQLTNNRLSSDLILRAILSMEQYRRLVEQRLPNAVGLDAADTIQADNPFAAFEGFKSSMQNLSAAILPMDHVSAALNTLADGINALAAAARENPALTALGIGVGGAALYGAGKFGISKMADMFGLRASAVALDGSAAALTRAAIALGGAGVADGAVPDGSGKANAGGAGALGLLGRAGGALAVWALAVQSMGTLLATPSKIRLRTKRRPVKHSKALWVHWIGSAFCSGRRQILTSISATISRSRPV